MTTFPASPRVQKGAIVGVDPFNPLASIIVFQYNPDTMTRTITAQTTGGDGDRSEALHPKHAPLDLNDCDCIEPRLGFQLGRGRVYINAKVTDLARELCVGRGR